SLFQFLILFGGVLTSCFFLYKYYADIKMLDAFTHCMRTVATTLFIVIIGNGILFYMVTKGHGNFSELTWLIMKTIFSYSISGILSSLFSSLIFNTFTKK